MSSAVSRRRASTPAGVSAASPRARRCAWRSATAPVTWGAENEVPFMNHWYAGVAPARRRSTPGPSTAFGHTTSEESVAVTAITSPRWPRYVKLVPPLPEAFTTTTPARVAAVTAASSPDWFTDCHEQLTTVAPFRVAYRIASAA